MEIKFLLCNIDQSADKSLIFLVVTSTFLPVSKDVGSNIDRVQSA